MENFNISGTVTQAIFLKAFGFLGKRAAVADAGDRSGQLRKGEQRKNDVLCRDPSGAVRATLKKYLKN